MIKFGVEGLHRLEDSVFFFFWAMTLLQWVIVSDVSRERSVFVFSAFFWELKNLECECTAFFRNVDDGLPSDAASYYRKNEKLNDTVLKT